MKAKVYSSNSANAYIEIVSGNFYSITPSFIKGESEGPGGIIVRPRVLVNVKRIKVKNGLKYKKYYKASRKSKGNRIGYVKSNTDNCHAQDPQRRTPKP
jgi:hypothetical protein